jgi:hypothetical protein
LLLSRAPFLEVARAGGGLVSGAPLIGPGGACAFALAVNASASAPVHTTIQVRAEIGLTNNREFFITASVFRPVKSVLYTHYPLALFRQ